MWNDKDGYAEVVVGCCLVECKSGAEQVGGNNSDSHLGKIECASDTDSYAAAVESPIDNVIHSDVDRY